MPSCPAGAGNLAGDGIDEVRLAQIVEERAVIQAEERRKGHGDDLERALDRLAVEYALKPSP